MPKRTVQTIDAITGDEGTTEVDIFELDEPITAAKLIAGDTLSDQLGLDPISRLTRDLKESTKLLTRREVRYLVDLYYTMQGNRIRAKNQVAALSASGEPAALIDWVFAQHKHFEGQLKLALNHYAQTEPSGMGAWSMAIPGIGPVIASGLLAHLDPARHTTVGQIWRFAGLDPTLKWERGQVRPWNADLKKLCFILAESFVKVQNRDGDIYGHRYVERKAIEIRKNEALDFKDQAVAALAEKNFGADTAARAWYEKDMLPPARIHARARRWAVKLFLAHYFEESFRRHFKAEPPLPYPIQVAGHSKEHYIPGPNPGLGA